MATRVPSTRCDFYVYCLIRGDTGIPFYIGKGRGNRWNSHVPEARTGKRGYRFNIIRDMLARDVEMPAVKIHEGLTEAVAHNHEMALIAAIGRHPHGPLANLTDGGEGLTGFIPSAESRAKVSASNRGYVASAEARAKLSAANIGKTHSPETRAKISAIQIGRKQSPTSSEKRALALRGRKRPPDVCAKISAAKRGKPIPQETMAKCRAAKLGVALSPQHRAKLSAANMGKKQPPEQIAKRVEAVRITKLRKRSPG